jgi:hypothetical protein
LGGFLKFPCLKPKTLLFMHAWLHKTEFRVRGRYIHDFLVWICLDLVYQLECLLYIWHKNAMSFVFSFSWFFFWFFMPIWIFWSNPRFDQYLNKFKTRKWKGNHGSFLVTLKWSFWDVLEISMFETQNDFFSCLTS